MSARDYALYQLDALPLPDWPSRRLRRHVPPPSDLRDLALAEQIRVGTIKHLLLLQHLCEPLSGRPLQKIDPIVQKILTVGLYQLKFLQRIPPHAVVDEAVEQARRFGRKSAAGFVNAVLRNALRTPIDEATLPTEIRFSHPRELLDRYAALNWDDAQIEAACRHNNAEPPTIVRLGPQGDPTALVVGGVTVTPHQVAGLCLVEGAKQHHLADWSARGVAQVQDATAAGVVPRMDLSPGMTVLDRCAGVGTKTLQIAEAVGPTGKVFAVEPNPSRCQTLRKTLAARGLDHVGVIEAGWMDHARAGLPAAFDRVLVDAPCSNSGVLARRPEAKYHQSQKLLDSLVSLQERILVDSAPMVRPGGLLIYSTCSIWPEENQQMALRLGVRCPQFKLLGQTATLPRSEDGPAAYRDGGFIAIFRRAN